MQELKGIGCWPPLKASMLLKMTWKLSLPGVVAILLDQ